MKKAVWKERALEAEENGSRLSRRVEQLQSELGDANTLLAATRRTAENRQEALDKISEDAAGIIAQVRVVSPVGDHGPGVRVGDHGPGPAEGTISSSLEIVTVRMMRGFASNAARAIVPHPAASPVEQQVVEGLRTLLVTAVAEGRAERIVTDGERT